MGAGQRVRKSRLFSRLTNVITSVSRESQSRSHRDSCCSFLVQETREVPCRIEWVVPSDFGPWESNARENSPLRTKNAKDTKNGIAFKLQHPQSVKFRGVHQENRGYRVDVLVEDKMSISGDILNRIAATMPPNLRLVPSVLFFDSSGGVLNRTGYCTSQVLFVSFVVKGY